MLPRVRRHHLQPLRQRLHKLVEAAQSLSMSSSTFESAPQGSIMNDRSVLRAHESMLDTLHLLLGGLQHLQQTRWLQARQSC